jgi:hypothetical protein
VQRFLVPMMAMAASCVWAQTTPAPAANPKPAARPIAAALKTIDVAKTDWRFAHPKPDLLLAINVGTITRSPFFQQMVQEAMKKVDSDQQKAQINMGLAIVKGIERVQISVHSTAAGADPDVLVLVTGQLDGMIRQMITQGGPKGMVTREIAQNAFLLGKAGAIDLAARRAAGVVSPAIADELATNDIWIAGDSGLLASAAKSPLPPGIDSLKKFSLGLNFRDPAELNINLSTRDEAGAEQLVALYNLAVAQAGTAPEASELVQAAKIERDGAKVRFRLSASAEILKHIAAARANAGTATDSGMPSQLPALLGLFGGPSAVSTVATPAPAPKPQGKIMIYGLEDGPKEVGAPQKQD